MSFRSKALIVEGQPSQIAFQMATEGIGGVGEKVGDLETQSRIISIIRNAFVGGRPVVDDLITLEKAMPSPSSQDDLSRESNIYPPLNTD